MKRLLAIVGMSLLVLSASQATILTNSNQSAEYLRMLSRNASTEIDAVYYNPAGLTQLADGFHLAVNNQTIFQKKTIILDPLFPFQTGDGTYVGDVKAPVFPSAFLAYKTGKLVLSFGFGPNAGGGSADYADGLPTFDALFSLVTILYDAFTWPVNEYSVDVSFTGTSVFFGYQLNASYTVTDWLSAAVGGRLLMCTNTYEGSVRNYLLNLWIFGWQPTGVELDVEAKEKGTAFTPIISLNFKPMEAMNVSLKYEFQTKVELTTETTVDDLGMFPDGSKVRSDLPAFLSAGVGYAIMPRLRAMLSFNYWFDKNMDWDGDPEDDAHVLNLDGDSWDLGVGIEYDLSEKFLVSAGYLHTQVSPGVDYQTDLRHELPGDTFAAGGRFMLSDNFYFNFGGAYSIYQEQTNAPLTFQRSNFGFTVGFGAHL